MKTRDARGSECKEYKRLQEKRGGIMPSNLEDGSKILIETSTFIYQITIDKNSGVKFIVDTGAPICHGNSVACEINAHYARLKYNMDDWVGKDMRMLLKFVDGANVMTGEVIGATLVTKGFEYEMWK